MPQKSQVDAYLTVYLSLSIPVILALILALLEGARVGATKMKSEIAVDIATNSVLGEYNRELFSKYSVLLLDDSFGTSNGSILKVQDHLSDYFTKNFEISPVGLATGRHSGINATLDDIAVTGYSLATDNEGDALFRQIVSYMEAEAFEGTKSKVEKNVEILKNNGFDTLDIDEKEKENEKEMSGSYTVDPDEDGETEEITIDNPVYQVSSKKSLGILTLAAPDFDSISDAAINADQYASNRKLRQGTGLMESSQKGAFSKLLMDEYIFEKCGRYGHETVDSPLKYELEYIYAGKDSDYANLEKVMESIFLWREASNFMHIMGDADKLEEAQALALTASVLIAVPELEEVIKMAVILAWTFAETVQDIRILMTGGKVPLVKTASDWKLSIEAMLDFQENLSDGGGRGLSYEDYLRMLLFMEKDKKKIFRLMDIMEMNVRQSEGNGEFRLDNCIDTFRADFTVKGRNLRNYEIERTVSYGQTF